MIKKDKNKRFRGCPEHRWWSVLANLSPAAVLLHSTLHDITLSPTFYLICMKLYHLLHSALLLFSTFYFSFYSVQSLPCLAVLDCICICANICRNVEWDHLSLLSPVPFNGSVGGPCRGQEDGGPGRQIVLQNHYNFVSVSVFVIVLVFVFVIVFVFVLLSSLALDGNLLL